MSVPRAGSVREGTTKACYERARRNAANSAGAANLPTDQWSHSPPTFTVQNSKSRNPLYNGVSTVRKACRPFDRRPLQKDHIGHGRKPIWSIPKERCHTRPNTSPGVQNPDGIGLLAIRKFGSTRAPRDDQSSPKSLDHRPRCRSSPRRCAHALDAEDDHDLLGPPTSTGRFQFLDFLSH